MSKNRLDILLAEQGLAPSRERAKALIMAGVVFVNGEKVDKAGAMVPDDAEIRVAGGELPYVSRGGLKLQKAIEAHHLDLTGFVCADIGASTGGFSDCMLQHGASRVYAIDVGYGQLAWKLRTDSRVVNLERTNIRYVTEEQIPEPLDFGSARGSAWSSRSLKPARARSAKKGSLESRRSTSRCSARSTPSAGIWGSLSWARIFPRSRGRKGISNTSFTSANRMSRRW